MLYNFYLTQFSISAIIKKKLAGARIPLIAVVSSPGVRDTAAESRTAISAWLVSDVTFGDEIECELSLRL